MPDDSTVVIGSDPRRLVDKVAVITGSAWGIGRATARLFAAHGARLVLVDIDESANAALATELSAQGFVATAVVADVGDATAVAAVATAVDREHGRVDVLFNNAGMMRPSTITAATADDWASEMSVNLGSVFICTKAFLTLLERSDGASVINNASVDGVLANHHMALYSTAKAGMVGLTRVMAAEFAAVGIRVNCLAPALINVESMAAIEGVMATMLDNLAANTPLRRRGRPSEVATAALFFATQDSSYITGVTVPVDGGRTQLTPGTF